MPQKMGLLDMIGAIADSFHTWLGLNRVSWGWRMVIAFFIVDMSDIALRVITLPLLFAFPLASHAAHVVFNTVIAFACAALWGAPGLIHFIDLGFGLIPGIFGDIILDVLPLATIAGLLALWRDENAATSSLTTTKKGDLMFGITLFIATNVALWWFGCITMWSIGWIIVTMLGFLFTASIIQFLPSRVTSTIIALLMAITAPYAGSRLGYLSTVSPESYREEIWVMLEEDGDVRIKAVQQADTARAAASKSMQALKETAKSAADVTGEVAKNLGSTLAEKLGNILKGVDSDVPAWNELAKSMGSGLAPEKQKEEEFVGPLKLAEQKKEEKEEPPVIIAGKKRGSSEVELYQSSYILNKGEILLNEQICWAKNILILSLGLLVYAFILNIASIGSNSGASVPQPSPEDDADLSL